MIEIDEKIANGTVPSAIIIEGSSPQKRLEEAMYIAKALVCVSDIKKPCGECSACAKASNNSHPDIFVLDCDEQRKNIKVDEIRSIREDAFVLPNEANKKVYIIPNAGLMNEQAQNALLKVFEEPPEYACFILTESSRNAFLETIRSRAMIMDLGKNEEVRDEAVCEMTRKLTDAVCDMYELKLLELIPQFEKDKSKLLLKKTLPELAVVFRDAIVIKSHSDKTVSCYPQGAEKTAVKFTVNQLLKLIRACDDIANTIEKNGNYNLILTRLCAKLRGAIE